IERWSSVGYLISGAFHILRECFETLVRCKRKPTAAFVSINKFCCGVSIARNKMTTNQSNVYPR
uniref:Uncharacterized protein n=1 Tax=Parascaris univalens TaxID=6257 RepID=A0A915B240_PARUN